MYRRTRPKRPSPLLVMLPALVVALGLVLQGAPASAKTRYVSQLTNGNFEGGRAGWEAGAAHSKFSVVHVSRGQVAQVTTSRRGAAVLSARPSAVRSVAKGQRFVASAAMRVTKGRHTGRLVIV